MRHLEPTQAIRYSPDGRLLAVLCLDHSIQLWDADTGWPLGPPLMHLAAPVGLAFVDDGKTLLSLTDAGVARSWPVPQPIRDDPSRFETWLQAHCGTRLDGEEPVQVTVEEWRDARVTLERDWPRADPALVGASDDLASWHQQRAFDAVEVGNDRGELHHLARLAELRPRQWALHLRLCRARLRVAADLPAGPARGRELLAAWTSLKRGLGLGIDSSKPWNLLGF
jgi:hypothetical protein